MAETTKSRKAKAGPRTVYIVGFAPSWEETPWGEPNAAYWGMNDLHSVKDAAEKSWTRWYQLHDIDEHHPKNAAEHIGWLNAQDFEVVMFDRHVDERVTNAVSYPQVEITDQFGSYFTNSVSWMIADAIAQGFEKISVWGVDMAQDSEYGHQRPSCEYFLGVAQGLGIEVEIAPTSDLLASPFLYGAEDGGPMRKKFDARYKELTERRDHIQGQLQQGNMQLANLNGAIEDTEYYLRAWSQEEAKPDGPEPQT